MNSVGENIQQLLLSLVRLFTPAEEFRNPVWLWFLLVVPVFLVWYTYRYANRRLLVKLSYDPEKLAKPGFNLNFLRFIPMLLQCAGYILIVLAMARPQSTLTYDLVVTEGIDIMLTLDVSASMETDDFPPNRLEIAKRTATRFVDGRKNDKIGIVVFAEDAITHVPLTLDYDLVKQQIANMHTRMLPANGTAVGSAIATAVNRMRGSKSKSKIIILLTDGASNKGQITPLKAAELAADEGIKVYSIAIGKDTYQSGGLTFPADLDESTLMKISETTRGKFFRSTDPNSLNEIFDTISKMETTKIEDQRYREVTDVYAVLLTWGICFFALAFLLMVTFLYNPFEG